MGNDSYAVKGATADGNWWGQPSGANTPGADTASGGSFGSPLLTPPLSGCSDKLTVLGGGTGSGTVGDTTPGGEIACTIAASIPSDDCEAWRVAGSGTTFTLVASPDPGSVFSEWTGCPSPSGNTCSLTLSTDTTVTTNFDLIPPCGLANCSFEEPGSADAFPDSWKRGGVKLNVDGTDTSFQSDGSQSFRFLNAKPKAKKLYQDMAISGPAGTNFNLSFDWRGDGVTGKKGLFRVMAVLTYVKGGSGKFYVNMPVGAADWTSYSLPMTAKKAYKKLRVEIDFGKKGTAWFDNFELTTN